GEPASWGTSLGGSGSGPAACASDPGVSGPGVSGPCDSGVGGSPGSPGATAASCSAVPAVVSSCAGGAASSGRSPASSGRGSVLTVPPGDPDEFTVATPLSSRRSATPSRPDP